MPRKKLEPKKIAKVTPAEPTDTVNVTLASGQEVEVAAGSQLAQEAAETNNWTESSPETGETQPEISESSQEPTQAELTEPTSEVDASAQCFYVYNDKNEFVQFYTVAEYGVDALKKAQEHAEAIGGSVK